MVVVAGFGNPLLDITVKIPDPTILHKYNLNDDDQRELPSHKMKALLHDVHSLGPSLSPGGSTQNTLRILQWILGTPNSTIMFGAIGQDTPGKSLTELVEAAGVQTRYIEHEHEPTGTAVSLISGVNRSLVAYIGAAKHVEIGHLQTEYISDVLKTIDLVYMEGFFLPERTTVTQYVHQYCHDNKIIFTFNLSAVYMCINHPQEVLYFAKNCDILIGNHKEYEALIMGGKLDVDVRTFAVNLSKDYHNIKSLKYGKIVIMTNGSKSVLCVHSAGEIEEIPVPKVDASKIGDTNGAGDAFAAGFLGGMFAGRSPVSCLKWGCWTAQQIIQHIGCTVPTYSAEFLKTIE